LFPAQHKFQLAYHNEGTGWFMGLVSAPAEDMGEEVNYEVHGGKASEWLLINTESHDVFGHEGDTVIPGAGIKWTHLHRSAPHGPAAAPNKEDEFNKEDSVPEEWDDNEDELPWQVI
jgi:hypothetical protein